MGTHTQNLELLVELSTTPCARQNGAGSELQLGKPEGSWCETGRNGSWGGFHLPHPTRCRRFPLQALSERLDPRAPGGLRPGWLQGGPGEGRNAGRGGRPLKPKTSAQGPRLSASGPAAAAAGGPGAAGGDGAAAPPVRGAVPGGVCGVGWGLARLYSPHFLVKVLVTPSPVHPGLTPAGAPRLEMEARRRINPGDVGLGGTDGSPVPGMGVCAKKWAGD